jgi:signal peptidase II
MEGRGFMKLWGPYSALGAIAGIAALAMDQWFKSWLIGVFDGRSDRKITLAPFFDLEMAWNQGISYGLFKQNSEMGQWALVAISCVAVLALAYWLAHVQSRIAALSIGLIMGGALGNAVDRARFGAVADFFSFHAGSFHWYIFNLADVAIVAGVAGLLFESLHVRHKSAGKQA